MHNSSAICEVD